MKNHLFKFLFFLPFLVFSQSSKSFEGVIKFEISVVIKESSENDNYHKEKYGNRMNLYISDKGDFKREYINSGNYGYDFIIYNSKTNNLYAKLNSLDSIYYYSAEQNFVKLNEKTVGESETIFGQECKSITINSYDPTTNQPANTTYYFSGKPYIDPKLYKNYKDFYYDIVIEEMKSPYLKLEMDLGNYIVIMEAIDIIHKDLDNNLFEIPKENPLARF